MRWPNVAPHPFGITWMTFGLVALPLLTTPALRLLTSCFVHALTRDSLSILKKTVHPTTTLVLLGVRLDTVTQEMRIDSSRLTEIFNLLNTLSTKRRCTKRQLQSLIGKLHFICNVCRPGRTFLGCMIDVLCKVHHPIHHLRLNRAFHMDLSWWRIFLPSWNGCSFFFDDEWISSTHLELYTDGCESGFEAYFSGHWLYGLFADHDIPNSRSITFKELYAIAAAVHTWSDSLACPNILFKLR